MTEKNNENFVIIDAKDMILGRLGSNISKRLLLGEKIKLVNCKDVIIIGNRKFLVNKYKDKLKNKVIKQGPYYSRSPANIVKRSFRNMLPYKNERGVKAYKNLLCYNSVPSILIKEQKEIVEDAKMNASKTLYFTKVEEISKVLGWTNKIN